MPTYDLYGMKFKLYAVHRDRGLLHLVRLIDEEPQPRRDPRLFTPGVAISIKLFPQILKQASK
jgi:hypothetical protein